MAKNTAQNKDKRHFTGLYDDFPKELTDSRAWAYAAINRHCMMREGICRASQATLAKESRMTRLKFRRAQIWLIQNDYVIDKTPQNKASCHTLEINDWKRNNNQDDEPEPWQEDNNNSEDNNIQVKNKPKKHSSQDEEDAPWNDDWPDDDDPEDDDPEDKSIQKVTIPEDDINSKEINHLNHRFFKMVNHKLVDTRINASSEVIDNDE